MYIYIYIFLYTNIILYKRYIQKYVYTIIRFLYDTQIGQLSAWVRPWIQKHTKFHTSMQAFRSFLIDIQKDDQLRYEVS
jgi:hypothetical protein